MKILLVEKSALVAGRMLSLLEEAEEKYQLYCCHNYHDAAEKLKVTKPDLVLLEAGLPQHRSRKLFRQIRSVYPGAAVIILLHHRSDHGQEKRLFPGARYFLDKYYDSSRIVPIVKQIIQSHKNNEL